VNELTWGQALAWRMRRQMLEPVGKGSVDDVVGRLGAVQAKDDFATELSVNTRRRNGHQGDVAAALADGRLIKVFAFRGATHLVTPEDGGIYLALRAASKMWELPSWQSYYGLKPTDWPDFRAAVREALADGPLTFQALGSAVTTHARFRHLRFAFGDKAWTLLKALMWQGDMCFGPTRAGQHSSAWTPTRAGRACPI
jgi:winged helix DNA-binding protein